MKLLSSFKKELILASRGFYFYVEILFAVIILAVLLFAIPVNFSNIQTEYLHLNLPQQGKEIFSGILLIVLFDRLDLPVPDHIRKMITLMWNKKTGVMCANC